MGSLYTISMNILYVVQTIMIVHIIMSWLINFQVLNLRQPLVYQIWDGLNRLLEPMYSRIRRFLPPMQGIDLAPLVAFLIIMSLRTILMHNKDFFY
ncbi:MAG: YggT family protein [Paracoccaceae bacterium]